jgi:NAD(P)-dependent dehydrogenase (short-subunit alcohol dehydrogenase family)
MTKVNVNAVWMISGCSSGFGRELARKVIEKGYRVLVCSRKTADVEDIVALNPERAKSVQLDLEKKESIDQAVQQGLAWFGRIDVLVNNAGVGYFSSAEEADMTIARKMFEVNFFGLSMLTAKVLPGMRASRYGHILNVSSIGGLVGFPAVSFYNATKFAVNGYSESLAKETAHLGIRITIVSPSGFRTDWAGRSAFETPVQIEDYASSAGANLRAIRSRSGKQAGDPVRAAEMMIKVVESEHPPLYLMLGVAALDGARKKLQDLSNDFDAWEQESRYADAAPAESN